MEERKVAPSEIEWTVEEEVALTSLELEPILTKETALGHLKEHHMWELRPC